MTVVDVVWLSYREGITGRDYWDHAMLEDVFSGKMWSPVGGYTFRHVDSFDEVKGDGAIIVFPARDQIEYVAKLNEDLAKLKWVVIFFTGDEQSTFPVDKIVHDNMKVWVMSPRIDVHGDEIGKLPNGYPPHISTLKRDKFPHGDRRSKDWFFSGQININRRDEFAKVMRRVGGSCEFRETDGFGKGMGHWQYYQRLANSKVIPCPCGPFTPDTFRLYEALEAGCVPVVDGDTPKKYHGEKYLNNYFTYLFNELAPFLVFNDYVHLPGYIHNSLQDWQKKSNSVYAWWQKYKRKLVYQIHEDIKSVSKLETGDKGIDDYITVIVPTSSINSHPSTAIIEETINSIRERLPDAEILIMVDGITRDKDKNIYETYVHRLLWKCNHEWNNILPILFDTHSHQAIMAYDALDYIKTPLLLYVEHDAPLCGEFDWQGLINVCMEGDANVIRFHHESKVLREHEYLMVDHETQIIKGVPMRRAAQWSQRPHLASVIFYTEMLERYFDDGERAFIEDRMHGVVAESYEKSGVMGWYGFRLWMYCPKGSSIQRSYHLDGRKSE